MKKWRKIPLLRNQLRIALRKYQFASEKWNYSFRLCFKPIMLKSFWRIFRVIISMDISISTMQPSNARFADRSDGVELLIPSWPPFPIQIAVDDVCLIVSKIFDPQFCPGSRLTIGQSNIKHFEQTKIHQAFFFSFLFSFSFFTKRRNENQLANERETGGYLLHLGRSWTFGRCLWLTCWSMILSSKLDWLGGCRSCVS